MPVASQSIIFCPFCGRTLDNADECRTVEETKCCVVCLAKASQEVSELKDKRLFQRTRHFESFEQMIMTIRGGGKLTASTVGRMYH